MMRLGRGRGADHPVVLAVDGYSSSGKTTCYLRRVGVQCAAAVWKPAAVPPSAVRRAPADARCLPWPAAGPIVGV